jgi:hypothetical protein
MPHMARTDCLAATGRVGERGRPRFATHRQHEGPRWGTTLVSAACGMSCFILPVMHSLTSRSRCIAGHWLLGVPHIYAACPVWCGRRQRLVASPRALPTFSPSTLDRSAPLASSPHTTLDSTMHTRTRLPISGPMVGRGRHSPRHPTSKAEVEVTPPSPNGSEVGGSTMPRSTDHGARH